MLIFKYVIVVPVRSGSYIKYFTNRPLAQNNACCRFIVTIRNTRNVRNEIFPIGSGSPKFAQSDCQQVLADTKFYQQSGLSPVSYFRPLTMHT